MNQQDDIFMAIVCLVGGILAVLVGAAANSWAMVVGGILIFCYAGVFAWQFRDLPVERDREPQSNRRRRK